MVTAISVLDVMKMGNIVPRAGLEPTSLHIQASVLPLHHVGSLMLPMYPSLPIYASEVRADYYWSNNRVKLLLASSLQ